MDFLQLKYSLVQDQIVERTLFLRVYKLVDDEDKTDKVLEVLNIPFFVEETDLYSLFRANDLKIQFTNNKPTDKLKTKTALVEFATKKDLKTELRFLKYADENEKLFLYKNKDEFKNVLTKNCGKSLLSKRFTRYIEDIDETREKVMEIVNNYNEEILVSQNKKKRRFEREDDGWVKVVRK